MTAKEGFVSIRRVKLTRACQEAEEWSSLFLHVTCLHVSPQLLVKRSRVRYKLEEGTASRTIVSAWFGNVVQKQATRRAILEQMLREKKNQSWWLGRRTYKNPTTSPSVDTDDDWKAEQVVEPCSGMHAAIATGDVESAARRIVLKPVRDTLRLLRGIWRPIALSVVRGRLWVGQPFGDIVGSETTTPSSSGSVGWSCLTVVTNSSSYSGRIIVHIPCAEPWKVWRNLCRRQEARSAPTNTASLPG